MISIIKIAKLYVHLMHPMGATDDALTIKNLKFRSTIIELPLGQKTIQ